MLGQLAGTARHCEMVASLLFGTSQTYFLRANGRRRDLHRSGHAKPCSLGYQSQGLASDLPCAMCSLFLRCVSLCCRPHIDHRSSICVAASLQKRPTDGRDGRSAILVAMKRNRLELSHVPARNEEVDVWSQGSTARQGWHPIGYSVIETHVVVVVVVVVVVAVVVVVVVVVGVGVGVGVIVVAVVAAVVVVGVVVVAAVAAAVVVGVGVVVVVAVAAAVVVGFGCWLVGLFVYC